MMDLIESLRVIHETRVDEVVVTTMGTGREWASLEPHELDFIYVPSSMGQATSLALGLALAQPKLRVICCNGDGSMLMNLGSLVTITAKMPRNLAVIVFDNGVYEITGRQATPGSKSLRANSRAVDYVGIAKACGFEKVFDFSTLDEWQAQFKTVAQVDGPVFVRLQVQPMEGEVGPRSPGPAWGRAEQFRKIMLEDGRNS